MAEDVPADHSITEWFGLIGTFKGHLSQPSRNEHGHLQLDRVELAEVTFCGFFLRFFLRLMQTALSTTSGPR